MTSIDICRPKEKLSIRQESLDDGKKHEPEIINPMVLISCRFCGATATSRKSIFFNSLGILRTPSLISLVPVGPSSLSPASVHPNSNASYAKIMSGFFPRRRLRILVIPAACRSLFLLSMDALLSIPLP